MFVKFEENDVKNTNPQWTLPSFLDCRKLNKSFSGIENEEKSTAQFWVRGAGLVSSGKIVPLEKKGMKRTTKQYFLYSVHRSWLYYELTRDKVGASPPDSRSFRARNVSNVAMVRGCFWLRGFCSLFTSPRAVHYDTSLRSRDNHARNTKPRSLLAYARGRYISLANDC